MNNPSFVSKFAAIILTVLLSFSSFFASMGTAFAGPPSNNPGDILINEFLTNPSGASEWYELFNTTGSAIDLSGWTIDRAVPGNSISLSGTLPANGILVFTTASDPANDTGNMLTLKDSSSTTIHAVSYGDVNPGGLVPHSSAPALNGSAYISGYGNPLTYSTTDSPSKGWFNDAVPFDCSTPPASAPTLSSIATCLSAPQVGITTNMGTISNPSATPDTEAGGALYFEKTGKGKIVFEKTLNLSNQDAVAVLQLLGQKMEMSDGHIKFDSDTATAMTATGAKIYMYGLDALGFTSEPSIIVKNDIGTVIDGAGIVTSPDYSAGGLNGGQLSFSAAHFTQFDLNSNVYVDDNDVTCAGNSPCYSTIQAGINAAPIGGTVNVGAGTYAERIEITKPLNLIGAGIGNSIIDATSFSVLSDVIKITTLTGNTKIEGFDIKTGDYSNGITASGGTDASGKIEIKNNHIISTNSSATDEQFGIIAGYGNLRKLIISGNQISNTYSNSILVEKQVGETEITNNTLDGAFPSIFFMTYGELDITSLQKVDNNTIDMMDADPTWYGSAITFNSARRNVPETSLGLGKYTNISITGNNITNLSLTEPNNYKGIHLINDDPAGTGGEITNAIISNNQISGASGNNAVGIKLSGKITNTIISNNVISNLSVGLLGVSNNNGAGTQYPSTTTLSDKNSILGNTLAVDWPSDSPLLNAKNNWWGNASGPLDNKTLPGSPNYNNPSGTGSPVSSYVDYEPWFINSEMTILNFSPTTNAATDITLTDATLNGTNGGYDATGYSFWVSLNPSFTITGTDPATDGAYTTPNFGAISANAPFSASLTSVTGLPAVTPGTPYYFVAWSEVGGTWYHGAIETFTTAPLDTTAPTVTKLGDGTSDYQLPPLQAELFGATMVFSEKLSSDSRTAVENALNLGADKTLTFKWNDNNSGDGSRLRISVTGETTATFANDVTANLTDLAGNTTTDALLIDSFIDLTPPEVTSAETQDLNGNGKIDAIKLTFNEAIDDSRLAAGADGWDVADYSGESIGTGSSENDNILLLSFDEGSTPDTGSTPAVTYTATGGPGSTHDLAGNELVSNSWSTTDKASPTIVPTIDATGPTTVVVTFDEDLQNDSEGHHPAPSDFIVYNGESYDGENSYGIDSVSYSNKKVTLTLSTPILTGDNPHLIIIDNRATIIDLADNEFVYDSTYDHKVYVAPVITQETAPTASETTTSITVTWTTDHPATSRVVYDTVSHSELGAAPNYGYAHSTVEDTTLVTSHSVVVSGLTAGTTYFLRSVSHGSPESVSSQITGTTNTVSSGGGGGSATGTLNINVSKTGTGTGTVTSNPALINCGATCTGAFTTGSSVTLTATPTLETSHFAGWGGDCATSGINLTCTLSMTANKNVTAAFDEGRVLGASTDVPSGGSTGNLLVLDQGTIYLISNGQRRPFATAPELFSYGFHFSDAVPATGSDMALPLGDVMRAMDGTLALDTSNGHTVYLIGDNGMKQGFTSLAVFTGLGFHIGNIVGINLSSYTAGSPITTSTGVQHPNGSVVKSGGAIFYLNFGKLYGFPSMSVFTSYGLTLGRTVTANSFDLALPAGTTMQARNDALSAGNMFP